MLIFTSTVKIGTLHCQFYKPMEVFRMDKYYEMDEVRNAIEAVNGRYEVYQQRPQYWRLKSRQWDYLIRVVCAGCGKPLSRYETVNDFAHCSSCRMVLFPETVTPEEEFKKRSPYSRSWGHFRYRGFG
jgi:hypothetical protein